MNFWQKSLIFTGVSLLFKGAKIFLERKSLENKIMKKELKKEDNGKKLFKLKII